MNQTQSAPQPKASLAPSEKEPGAMELDHTLRQYLHALSPHPSEQRSSFEMYEELAGRLSSAQAAPPQVLRWPLWGAAMVCTFLCCFVYFGDSRLPETPQTSTRSGHYGEFTSKGSSAPQLQLRVLHSSLTPTSWKALAQKSKVSRHSKLSLSFSLHQKGGYATILWARPQQELSLLYRSTRSKQGNRFITISRGSQLVQYPLVEEKQGHILLFLLQSASPLSDAQIASWKQSFLRTKNPSNFFTKRIQQNHQLLAKLFRFDIVAVQE